MGPFLGPVLVGRGRVSPSEVVENACLIAQSGENPRLRVRITRFRAGLDAVRGLHAVDLRVLDDLEGLQHLPGPTVPLCEAASVDGGGSIPTGTMKPSAMNSFSTGTPPFDDLFGLSPARWTNRKIASAALEGLRNSSISSAAA